MGKNGFIVAFSIFILVSNACSSVDFQLRKLNANEPHNATANSSVKFFAIFFISNCFLFLID